MAHLDRKETRWRRAAMVLALSILCSGCSSIPARVWTAPINCNDRLCDEGAFVEYPTIAGDVIGMPLSILTLPINGMLEPVGTNVVENVFLSWESIFIFPSMVGDIVGTPFFVVKEVCWNLPASAFAGETAPASGRAPAEGGK